jgi:phage terminase large subunit-like protein
VSDWSLACPDWRERIRAGRSLLPPLPGLNEAEAARAVESFNELRLPDVRGRPKLERAGGDWFRDIVRALHGSYDPETGVRHIREVFVLAPKKSSKTTYSAALMLTSLLLNRRPQAEFILIAPTQEVTDVAFSQAVGMVEADPFLSKRMYIRDHIKTIQDRATKARLKIKSFDPKVVTGVKPVGVLLDELHTVPQNDADRVVGQLRGGLVSQPEAFLVIISTQSERPPSGVFRAELLKARAIRDGRIPGAMLPILYEFPEDVDWRDPSKWWMVTPNRDLSVTVDRLVPDYEAAKEAGEEELRRWASQHLNVEIGLALRSDRWVGAEYWEARGSADLTLDALLQRSEVVCIGIDGGGLDDLLGLAVLGRDKRTREWLLWCHAWCFEGVLSLRKSEAARLRDLERAGDLTIVERLGDDVEAVADLVERVDDSGLLHRVGLDPVGVGSIVDALAERGIEGDRVVGISQGWKLSGAIKTTERKLADGTLTHSGQALMAWAVGNAKVEPKGNAIVITKQASGTAKIDPLMAAFDAVALMSTNPAVEGGSFSGYLASLSGAAAA